MMGWSALISNILRPLMNSKLAVSPRACAFMSLKTREEFKWRQDHYFHKWWTESIITIFISTQNKGQHEICDHLNQKFCVTPRDDILAPKTTSSWFTIHFNFMIKKMPIYIWLITCMLCAWASPDHLAVGPTWAPPEDGAEGSKDLLGPTCVQNMGPT